MYIHINPVIGEGFCFVPTVSALDITNIDAQSLMAGYSGGLNPSNPSRFSNFIAQETFIANGQSVSNIQHPLFTPRNAEWMFREMESITPNSLNCPVNCTNISPDLLQIWGSKYVCSYFQEYEFTATAVTGLVYNWMVSSNLQIISGQGTNKIKVKKLNNGTNSTAWVEVGVGLPCNQFSARKNLQTSFYLQAGNFITGYSQVRQGEHVTYTIKPIADATNYTWWVVPDASEPNYFPTCWELLWTNSTKTSATFRVGTKSATIMLSVAPPVTGNCSSIVIGLPVTWVSGCPPNGQKCYNLKIGSTYPNPTKGSLSIEIEADQPDLPQARQALTEFDNEVYQLSIYDFQGEEVYTQRLKGLKNTINVNKLKDGLYLVKIQHPKFGELANRVVISK